MAKRKRKAPKRRRRRNRFGNPMVNELKKELMSPIAEELEKIKDEDLVKKIPSGTPPKVIETSKIIKKSLIEDFKDSDQTLTKTKATIKQAEEDGANAFYKMIDASEINTKMGEIFEKAKTKALKSIPGGAIAGKLFSLDKLGKAITLVYNKTKDPPKKLIFHVISKIVIKDFPENAKDLVEQAGGVAKQAGDKIKNQVTGGTTTPAPEATKKETKPVTAEATKKETTTATTEAKTGFGKRKKGPSASLKRMCKKHGVRLTVKRGKKRVYKSSKVLKEQCQRKLKKNFGRKKIKRSSIMPPKRKRRGKKRKTTMRQRLSAAADYARKNKGTIAGGLAGAGLSAAALNELQLAARRGYKARKNKTLLAIKEENMTPEQKKQLKAYKAEQAALASPTLGLFRRGKDKAIFMRNVLVGFSMLSYEDKKKVLSDLSTEQIESIKDAAQEAYQNAKMRGMSLRDRFTGLFKKKEEAEYGKRRRRRKSKYDFGKKAKKPSAAIRRMCKKLKVRMTLKRGGKRVYKSEAMLKKQCKKAMKRKSKK